ncbi:MAG TPA: hypothetical protein DHW10_00785, partial [Rhodospirillaceae bacterium]|nr:hypothetical protein [Rhodospirillaceae bacterium]
MCMSKKGVSIIIPCHNDARFLREAIESVYAQNTSLPFEIIVIDDGSTDDGSVAENTKEILDDVRADYPDVRLYRYEESHGPANARNLGLSLAQYDYIFPLDADNKLEIDPNILGDEGGYMDRAVAKLENDPDTVLVHCQGRLFDGASGRWRLNDYDEKRILTRNMIDTHAIYRRKEARVIGGYNIKQPYAEDWDFAVAMINERIKNNRPARVHKVRDPLFCYRIRKDQNNFSARGNTEERRLFVNLVNRSPEIYQRHYPHCKSRYTLIDTLMQKSMADRVRFHLGRAFNPMAWGQLVKEMPTRIRSASQRLSGIRPPKSTAEISKQEKAFRRQDSRAP